MSYIYTLEQLLEVLEPHDPVKVASILSTRRKVEHGLLPVGLKIHYLIEPGGKLNRFVAKLGGFESAVNINGYRRERAKFCLVLPPVGNARTAISLLECIGAATDCPVFNNEEVEFQICTAGRLNNRHSALLTLCFHFCSDIIRDYRGRGLGTTFSENFKIPRGRRLAIYDAYEGGNGVFDGAFDYWGSDGKDGLSKIEALPFENRTDVIYGKCRRDIENVNLVGTLLVHAEFGGFWQKLGRRFVHDMLELLTRHEMAGLLSVPWVRTDSAGPKDDEQYALVLDELSSISHQEVERLSKSQTQDGILKDVFDKLERYRKSLYVLANRATQEKL